MVRYPKKLNMLKVKYPNKVKHFETNKGKMHVCLNESLTFVDTLPSKLCALIVFLCSLCAYKNDPKSMKNRLKINQKSLKIGLGESLERGMASARYGYDGVPHFWSQIGSILVPKIASKPSQKRSRNQLQKNIGKGTENQKKTSKNGTHKEHTTAIFLDLAVLLIFEGCP